MIANKPTNERRHKQFATGRTIARNSKTGIMRTFEEELAILAEKGTRGARGRGGCDRGRGVRRGTSGLVLSRLFWHDVLAVTKGCSARARTGVRGVRVSRYPRCPGRCPRPRVGALCSPAPILIYGSEP